MPYLMYNIGSVTLNSQPALCLMPERRLSSMYVPHKAYLCLPVLKNIRQHVSTVLKGYSKQWHCPEKCGNCG